MNDRRVIADVHDYHGLIHAIRERKAELGMSDAALDEIAGLPPGYAGKVLGQSLVKRLGPMSLSAVVGALGLRLTLVEDPMATAKIVARFVRRDEKRVRMRPMASIRRPTWLFTKRSGRKAAALYIEKVPERKRKTHARRAANERWRRYRANRSKVIKLSAGRS